MPEYYPVTMYNWDGRFVVCSSKAHKEALGKGWYASLVEAKAAHDAEDQPIADSPLRIRQKQNAST